MTVVWKESALDDRERLLEAALEHAIEAEEPAIYRAALTQDDRIQREGDALDGVATYKEGPVEGTRLYTCAQGRIVLLYVRAGHEVQILWVAPTASNWKR